MIKTQHKASISFLEWSGSGHALLSVDQCGECRLWEMKVRGEMHFAHCARIVRTATGSREHESFPTR